VLRFVIRWFGRQAPNMRTNDEARCDVLCPVPCKEPCPLLALPVGTRALILRLGCPLADASRLRVLGVFEGAYVRIVDRRHGILLDVRGSRLALDRAVAMDIIASSVAA
jgi:Fe2+ transport system protein FeoA